MKIVFKIDAPKGWKPFDVYQDDGAEKRAEEVELLSRGTRRRQLRP